MVTHGVVIKVLEKSIVIEFYNNVRAYVPAREARSVQHESVIYFFPC